MSGLRVSKIGAEILVNTTTAHNQSQQVITALANGGFVVTWSDQSPSNSGQPNNHIDVKAQIFAADGTKIGTEILVNTATDDDQFFPQITSLSNGGFVVTWEDWSPHPIVSLVKAVEAQVFAPDGAKIGAEILVVNTVASENDGGGHQIAPLSNGGFVVTWADTSRGIGGATGDDNGWAVKAQVFAASGAKVGAEILVNTFTAGNQGRPLVEPLTNGGFVVTWEDGTPKGYAVKAQVFAASGAKVGPEILVNTATDGVQGLQDTPRITALSNGGFVVAWRDRGEYDPASVEGVRAKVQVFAADGTKAGAEIFSTRGVPNSITTLSNGGFVVAWSGTGIGGEIDTWDWAVKAQVFAADGTKVGEEVLVNTATVGNQTESEVTALPGGGFVVTWLDTSLGILPIGDTGELDIKAQIFTADGTKVGAEILVNTATVGEQSRQRTTSLPNGGFVVTWYDGSQGAGGATDGDLSAIKAQVFGFSSGPAASGDFDGDGASDLLLQNTAGAVVAGSVENGALAYSAVAALGHEWTFEGNGDFFGDGTADFLVQHEHGAVVVADVESGHAQYVQVAQLGSEWKLEGAGDFLGAGHDQFLIENDDGAVVVGDAQSGQAHYTQVAALGSEWKFRGAGDFLGNGHDQFLIENDDGAVVVGNVQNGQAHYTQVAALGSEWTFVGTGDFLGLGHDAFLIENKAGAVVVGDVQNGQVQYTQVGGLGDEWSFIGSGDYLGDGTADFVIENKAGEVFLGAIANGQASYAQVGALGSEWQSHS